MNPPINIFSAVDENYKPISSVTWPLLQRWCDTIGYVFHGCDLPPGERHSAWRKIDLLLNKCISDYVNIWCDADIFWRDYKFDIAPFVPENGIAFSQDYNGLCSGFFIVKGDWAWSFLRMAWALGPVHGSQKHEQDTIKVLHQNFVSVTSMISLIPETVITNRSGVPINQAAAYHAWAEDWKDNLLQNAQSVQERL